VQTAPGVLAGHDTAEALLAFARQRLARFKVPKSVDFAESLPRDPNGKMVKRHLRDPYWQKANAS
jgi:long-chain acyl-CoA synthetase